MTSTLAVPCYQCGWPESVAVINGKGMCQEHIDVVMARVLEPVKALAKKLADPEVSG